MAGLSRHRGFTLVELLVVIAVIGVLMSLLLPAVQMAREAVRRANCQNNLRQLGLALHVYHDTMGAFPQAFNACCPFTPPPNDRERRSWLSLLLPYVEQQNLESQGFAIYEDKNVSTYLCPSDPLSGRIVTLRERRGAITDYLAVDGRNYGFSTAFPGNILVLRESVLYGSSWTRAAEITDGLSNTVIVGERPAWHDGKGTGSWGWWTWYAWDATLAARVNVILSTTRTCPYPAIYSPGRSGDPCDVNHFWSYHPGGAHFLLADCSVRFLPYQARLVMERMVTRSGGEIFEVP